MPYNQFENELIDQLLDSFDSIRTKHPQAGVTFLGDLNQLDTSQLCLGNVLQQVVTQPTREGAILDKIITNLADYYQQPNICSPIGTSDHCTVLFLPKLKTTNKENTSYT